MFRGASVRKSIVIQTRYVVLIQKSWRRYYALSRYATEVKSVARIQAAIRSWRVRADLAAKGLAAVTIQSKWRYYRASSSYLKMVNLAIAIQSLRRGLQVRRELQFLIACASTIQATWRRYSAEVHYQVNLIDIILVQSVCRRRMAVMEYKKQTAALLVIQSLARMCLAQRTSSYLREETAERKQQQAASVCLQVRSAEVPSGTNSASILLALHSNSYVLFTYARALYEDILRFELERSRFTPLCCASQLLDATWSSNKRTLRLLVRS